MTGRVSLRMLALAAAVIVAALAGAYMLLGPGRLSYTERPGTPSTSTPVEATAPGRRATPAPMAFTGPGGRAMGLDDLKGKVVLVNLWATWCPPCVAEMPALDGLQGAMGGKDFQVVAVSLDRGGAPVVERWFTQAGIRRLEVFTADPQAFPGAMLPMSILLDRQGRVAWQGLGARDWQGEKVKAVIRGLTAE